MFTLMFILFTCITARLFAFNIGASCAAASMGSAYGSGAMPIRKIAQFICGFGVLLGAVLGGGEVVKTIGSGIVPDEIITIHLALIILVSASIDRKSTRLNSSHVAISYAVSCLNIK